MNRDDELNVFYYQSVLPMVIGDKGSIDEVIIVDSVSGGAEYLGNMPKRVSLVRQLANGTEFRASYCQSEIGIPSVSEGRSE